MDRYIAEGDGFPGDNEFLMLIQSIIGEVSQLAALGGDNYILKGCEVNGNNVSPGFMVLDGEVLRFNGGPLGTHVHIAEDIENAIYLEDLNNDNQGDSKPTYFYRRAVFGNAQGAVVAWEVLKPLNPLVEVPKALTPVGTIVMWAGAINQIPQGWALCDGTNGTPNLKGRFIVGYDPNESAYNSIGKTGGQRDVTLSVAQMPQHNHPGSTNVTGEHFHSVNLRVDGQGVGSGPSLTKDTPGNDEGFVPWAVNPSGDHSHTVTTHNRGSNQPHENRPPFYTLAFIQFKGS